MIDTWIILLIAGFSAGLLGGLLEIGGVVLMPVLRFVVGLSPSMTAGTTVVTVFCTTLGGDTKHYRLGHVPLRDLFPVINNRAHSRLLMLLFGLIFLWMSTGFMLSKWRGN